VSSIIPESESVLPAATAPRRVRMGSPMLRATSVSVGEGADAACGESISSTFSLKPLLTSSALQLRVAQWTPDAESSAVCALHQRKRKLAGSHTS